MRIFMLGWEFPPFITGGLGTACYGLTRALDRRGIGVTFALPRGVAETAAEHVQLLSPQTAAAAHPGVAPGSPPIPLAQSSTTPAAAQRSSAAAGAAAPSEAVRAIFQHLELLGIPVASISAYARPGGGGAPVVTAAEIDFIRTMLKQTAPERREEARSLEQRLLETVLPEAAHINTDGAQPGDENAAPQIDYAGDLVGQVHRYAQFCLTAARTQQFDVIHAHDWLTFPAGLAVAGLTGKPLVVHVHSTEFDRSGEHVHQRIYDIERRGMHGAMKVITVSQLTKNTVVYRYGIPPGKVEVVYNGVEFKPTQPGPIGIDSQEKIVLYFGRITMQKGPEYFIRAAQRVLEYMDDVKFVVAGSGDMAGSMIEMAARMGIGHKVLFTGFLRGKDIERIFALADLYVMPSVSEPFGIAPLEAMSHDVPVIISKSSGVSEVLSHALKVDFWDTDDIANKIIAVLRHPPLRRALSEHGRFEVRQITWDGAAERCEKIYRSLLKR
ncbi:MAG: glycosyltransferase [Phycisphaerales bacterium]